MDAQQSVRLKLPHIIEMANVAECHAQLAPLLASGATLIALDVEDLVAADTAAVQLLASFVQSVGARGGRVEWENLSVPLCQAAMALGLEETLGI